MGALILAALLGLFGGTGSTTFTVSAPVTDLSVRVPQILRSGMFFEATIGARAKAPMTDATIAMPPSLWRNVTINTAIPQASEEDYKDGFFRMHFGPLDRGDGIELKIDGQINSNLFGGNRGDVLLLDGDRVVARLPVHITVRS